MPEKNKVAIHSSDGLALMTIIIERIFSFQDETDYERIRDLIETKLEDAGFTISEIECHQIDEDGNLESMTDDEEDEPGESDEADPGDEDEEDEEDPDADDDNVSYPFKAPGNTD